MTTPRQRALLRLLACAALVAAVPALVAPLGHTHAMHGPVDVPDGGVPAASAGAVPAGHAVPNAGPCLVCALGPRAAALAPAVEAPLEAAPARPVVPFVAAAVVRPPAAPPVARGPPASLLDA